MQEEQETKSLESYVEEFGKLFDTVKESQQAMCNNYAKAVSVYGLDKAERAYRDAYPPIVPLLQYILLVGQGKANVGVLSLGFETMRKRIIKLPIEEQNEFFGDGAVIRDFRTGEQKTVPATAIDSVEWQTLWDDGKNGFRTDEEQVAYIKNRTNLAAIHRRKLWELKKDGYIHVGKSCKLKILGDLVPMVLKCLSEYPELSGVISVNLDEFEKAKKAFKPNKRR